MEEELFFSIREGDLDAVSEILEQSDNDDVILKLLEYVNEEQWTGLDIACYEGHFKIVELILQKTEGASKSITDLTFPLVLALGRKHYDIFHLLLGYKDPSLAASVTCSENPLFTALTTGNIALFQILQDILKPNHFFHLSHAVDMMSPQQIQRCFLWSMEQQDLYVLRDVLLDGDEEMIAAASCLLPMPCQHHIFCTILKQYILQEKKKSLMKRVESPESIRERPTSDRLSQVVKSEVVQDIINQDLLSKDVISMVKVLGSDIIFQPSDEEDGNSLLHLAMSFGRQDVVSALLDVEIDFPTMVPNSLELTPIEVTDDDDLIGLVIRDKRSLNLHRVPFELRKTILRHTCSMDRNDETYYKKIDSFFGNNYRWLEECGEAVLFADESRHDYILWWLMKITSLPIDVKTLSRFFEALLAGHEHDAELKDNKGSFLHVFARNGFDRGIDYAMKNFDPKIQLHQKICSDLLDLYLQEDRYKRLPCMVAASYKKNIAILLLLQPMSTLSMTKGDNEARKVLNRFLHHKDNQGRNLLYLVSRHKQSLRLPHSIVVGLEYICHDEDMIAIQKCLKEHNIGNKKALKNTVPVESPGPCKRLINFIVRGILLFIPLGFFLLDIATDALLVRDYHREMENETILQQQEEAFRSCQYNVTLDCFTTVPTADTKFAISLAIMILPFLFYIVEVFRFIRILIIDITFLKGISYPLEIKNIQTLCSKAHVIEMATESSIQPFLQLYLFLPSLITLLQNAERLPELRLTELTNTKSMQFYSVIVSVLSMTYPFAANYRRKKAKDINMVGTVMYFTFTLCFIVSRLLAFQSFAYYFGPANFAAPAMLVICHIIITSLLDYIFKSYRIICQDLKIKTIAGLSIIYNGILNGFANIYVLNRIVIFDSKFVKTEFKDSALACQDWNWKFCNPCLNLWKRKAKLRQFIIFDVIIAVENIIMVSFGFAAEVYDNDPSYKKALDTGVFIILGLFVCGVTLKICYYSFCHVWSDLICQCGEADNESDEMMEMRVKFGSSEHFESQNNHVESARVPLMEPSNENQIEV